MGEKIAADFVVGEGLTVPEASYLVLRRLVNSAGLELDEPAEGEEAPVLPRKIVP